jgi:P pilus assembly chaperone PapD
MHRLVTILTAACLAFAAAACSTASSGSLAVGMTPDQTVQAMGPPDLKDSISDPNHSGATVLRYAWVDQGKVAVFGPNDKVASVQQMEPTQKVQAQSEAEQRVTPPKPFDPIQTPLDYAFYPFKAAVIYTAAGLNCATGALCQKPTLPNPQN